MKNKKIKVFVFSFIFIWVAIMAFLIFDILTLNKNLSDNSEDRKNRVIVGMNKMRMDFSMDDSPFDLFNEEKKGVIPGAVFLFPNKKATEVLASEKFEMDAIKNSEGILFYFCVKNEPFGGDGFYCFFDFKSNKTIFIDERVKKFSLEHEWIVGFHDVNIEIQDMLHRNEEINFFLFLYDAPYVAPYDYFRRGVKVEFDSIFHKDYGVYFGGGKIEEGRIIFVEDITKKESINVDI